MAIFRFLAWVLVALAIGLLGADGISSLESKTPVMRSTADVLGLFGFTIGAGENEGGGIAEAIGAVLALPLWGVLGVIGVVLTLIFRPID